MLESGAESALRHCSGLGLWIVDWVIRQSDGDVTFYRDEGTRVELTLDRA